MKNKIDRAQVGQASLRRWAKTHGSERLRLMLESGDDAWEGVATQEYAGSHVPLGFAGGVPKGAVARHRPTASELRHLRLLRARCKASAGVLSDPALLWVMAKEDENAETGEIMLECHYVALRVTVNTPNGVSLRYSRELMSSNY